MERISKIDRSKKTLWALTVCIFLFALILNGLTPYVADDYVYRLSFDTKKELTGVVDVVKSMAVHAVRMNGRVESRFLGQLFMLWPKAVFNVVNAAVLTALLVLVAALCAGWKRPTALLLACAAMGFWKFCPVFGQTALWQIGSVNYLWGLFFGTVFLTPYIIRFLRGEGAFLDRPWKRALFSVFSLLFGAYVEGMSFIAPLTAAALLLLSRVLHKTSLKTWLLMPVGLALAGYLVLMSMPAELAAKQTSMTLSDLIHNFATATDMLEAHGSVLLTVWLALEITGIVLKGDRDRLVLSAVFVGAALAANYMLTFVAYYATRCASPVVLFLLMACLTAGMSGIGGHSAGVILKAFLVCTLVMTFTFSAVSGACGILSDWAAFRSREAVIEAAREAGETDLVLPVVHPSSPYSAFWELLDLNTETRDTWPNHQMAAYYGVNSILGY